MDALSALRGYGEDDEELNEDQPSTSPKDTNNKSIVKLSLPAIDSATPEVALKLHSSKNLPAIPESRAGNKTLELSHNPTYEELYAPKLGPVNPFKSEHQRACKNTLTGFIEAAHINDFSFETQRRTFESFGFAQDPSADKVVVGLQQPTAGGASATMVVDNFSDTKTKPITIDVTTTNPESLTTVFETTQKRPGDKRKKLRNLDSSNIEGYTGPWGKYEDEETVARPDEETLKQMTEFAKKRKKFKRVTQEENAEEKSILHIKDTTDYQGRTFMHAPQDVGVNLRNDSPPEKCFVPKKEIHSWTGHSKGVQCIRWFPKTAHLLLSASMDCKIKLWEVYKGRRGIRSYLGHKMAVRDICFSNKGDEFLSASYDRYVKLWDTETGQVKQRFHTGKVPYCVKFNPDDDKQHMFLAGMQDKKIIQWDTRSGEIVQEYDRHLGAVNTITFFDQNRRFCSTSDDKSLRIWEWEIPVDTKLIQEPNLHSMPSVTLAPNQKWLACQAMDNKVMLFQVIEDKIRFAKKKSFKGHMVAGYACSIDFSPDMSYLTSGDADGKVTIWDWKTHRIVSRWKAHDNVCIGVLWHPHETSKVASCGWDGTIKLWD